MLTAKDLKELQQAATTYRAKYRPWAEWETKLVKDFYGRVPLSLLVKKLGRAEGAIRCKAQGMGCRC